MEAGHAIPNTIFVGCCNYFVYERIRRRNRNDFEESVNRFRAGSPHVFGLVNRNVFDKQVGLWLNRPW